MRTMTTVRAIRPYQLLDLVADQGEGRGEVNPLLQAIRADPDMPLCLRCNAAEVYDWQDPGTDEDRDGGAEFNLRRDLEILHRLDLFPGAVLPARFLLYLLVERVPDLEGIARFSETSDPTWRGCSPAYAAAYAKGRALGIGALLPPRAPDVLRDAKRESMETVRSGAPVKVRPHILLCAVCQYGGGTRPPYAEDNLPELLQMVLEGADVRIEMAPHADWTMCAPCPYRAEVREACVNNKGAGGISNELRDLRVLQKLGMVFGDVMEGKTLFRRILDRIPGTFPICRMHAVPGSASVWLTGCGALDRDSDNYAKGRADLLEKLNA